MNRLELVDICVRRSSDLKFLVVTNRRFDGWTAPSGKIEAGETPKQAAVRELEEEVGIRLHFSYLERVGVFEQRWWGADVRCYGYVALEEGWRDQEPWAPEEGTKIFWVDRDDLLDPAGNCLAQSYYGWLVAKMGW